jgi:diguanylate cyclase (GGDEF)-like protein
MNQKCLKKISQNNLGRLLLIAVVSAALTSALINYFQGLIWYGRLSLDLLVIGTIDAVIVTLIVAPLVIKLGIKDRQRIEAELRELTLIDDLTKLYNRRGFFKTAEDVLKTNSHSQMGMYLMYIDLDYFKKINDTYGHAEGDRALEMFSLLLRENFRESDVIARMGGDEFVLLPVGLSEEDVTSINRRFNKLIENFNNSQDNPWTFSATIGLSYYDAGKPCSLDELLKRADTEMYLQRKERRAAKTRTGAFQKIQI